jgi:two-component system response regulator HydG
MNARVCLVEDDPIMGESLCDRFALEGFAFDWHRTAGAARSALARQTYAAVVSDIRLPDLSGEELFRRATEGQAGAPPFIFITGYGSIDRAVEMLKLGAADYITKPFDIEQLIDKLRALVALPVETAAAASRSPELGLSVEMRRIEALLPRIAAHAATVLITGESGAGKEHVARALHRAADPADALPFVAVNCAALTETLLEAELFGHEKGAFTGAARARKGLFEQAQGGTLFLDEIGEMSAAMQVKLLRAIQERRVTRVGGEQAIPVDIRLVCATNRDLRALVEAGRFREDLYYRINVIHLRVPPLRARHEDVAWFARIFLAEFAARHAGAAKRLSVAAETALATHAWPGNLRELKHAIERACILSERPLLEPADLFEDPLAASIPPAAADELPLSDYLQLCERQYIAEAFERHGRHVQETATALGISRKNLWERMRRLGIGGANAGE